MVRNTAREIAIHLSYELSFTDKPVEELLDERLTPESFAALAEEDPLYQETPNAKQADYIRRLVRGVADHAPELDGYIAKYAKGWNFARIPLVASAIMRVAMYEILYMPDIPHGASINEAGRGRDAAVRLLVFCPQGPRSKRVWNHISMVSQR